MKKKLRLRADELLVQRKLAETPKQAQALIMAGKLIANEQRVDKPSFLLYEDARLRLRAERSPYASRGGEKLAGALASFALKDALQDKVVLDIGASTGGFTDCALKHGAKLVIALDVGTNQLAWSLRQDARVVALEQTDIRNFTTAEYPPIDWILADISFNSLSQLAPYIVKAGQASSRFLIMVKPQFELAVEDIPQGGVVMQQEARRQAVASVMASFNQLGLSCLGQADSVLKGRAGNQETFLLLSF